MTPDQLILLAKARRRRAEAGETAALPPAAPDTPNRETMAERLAYAPATRFAVGVGETLLGGPLQLGANIGNFLNPYIDKLLPDSMSSQGGPNVAEMIAGKKRDWDTLKKSTLEPGEWDVAGGLGNMAAGAAALPGSVPATLAKRVGYGIAGGAGFGAATMTDSSDIADNMRNAAVGSFVGGAFPALTAALGKVGGFLYHGAIEPNLKAGREAIKGRTWLAAADGKEQQLADALRSYKPRVEGYEPTAGQAAASVGSTGFSAMQDIAENARPAIKDAYVQRGKEQSAAMLGQVRSVGQDDEALKLAEALRRKNAKTNYGPMARDMVAPQADDALMEAEVANAARQKAEALQMAGKFETDAVQQQNLARGGMVEPPATNTGTGVTTVQPRGVPEQRVTQSAYPAEGLPTAEGAMRSDGMPGSAYPVPGQPRVPPRYTENAQRVPEARAAVEDAMSVYETRKIEENWLRDMQAKLLDQSGGASKVGLDDFLGSPSIKSALAAAEKAAAERRISFPRSPDEPFSVQNLQDIKYALDQGIKTARGAPQMGQHTDANVEALTGTRQAFVDWLESKSPEWAKARDTFAADSDPINRMEIGRFMEKKLTGAMGEEANLRPATYANAMDSAAGLAKKSNTGTDRFRTIDEAFANKPEELEKLRGVLGELQNDAKFNDLVREGRKVTSSDLRPFTDSLDAAGHGKRPQLWDRVWSVANYILDRAKGRVDRKLAEEMALEMLDPKATGRAIETAIARRGDIERTASALRRRSTQGAALAGQAAAGAGE